MNLEKVHVDIRDEGGSMPEFSAHAYPEEDCCAEESLGKHQGCTRSSKKSIMMLSTTKTKGSTRLGF